VSVRAAARLHVADVLRISDVADVEDAKSAQALLADGVLDALRAAVETSAISFAGDEEQVLVNRDIALRRGAEIPDLERRRSGIRDVPNLITVVIALNRVVSDEREVGVGDVLEFFGWLRRRDQPQVPCCRGCVEFSGAQSDADLGSARPATCCCCR